MIRFTQHAVERFVEHWRPGMSCEQAEGTLRGLIASAARTKINARGGDALERQNVVRTGLVTLEADEQPRVDRAA